MDETEGVRWVKCSAVISDLLNKVVYIKKGKSTIGLSPCIQFTILHETLIMKTMANFLEQKV